MTDRINLTKATTSGLATTVSAGTTTTQEGAMATEATHGVSFRLPTRRAGLRRSRETRVFETWRASIWTSAVLGTVALATTALNVVSGPSDEIVMATAYTLTGVLGHLAPIPE